MPFEDFLSDMMTVGGEGRGWKSWFVVLCIILGAVGGAWIGYAIDGVVYAIGGACLGAFLGWILGMVLRGFLIIGLIAIPILAVVIGWTWLTGGAG